MAISITGRRITPSGYLKTLISRKLQRVFRRLGDAGLSATVVVSREKLEKVVDISLHARGDRILHASGSGDTWQLASTIAVEKLERQADTLKGKWKDRRRR